MSHFGPAAYGHCPSRLLLSVVVLCHWGVPWPWDDAVMRFEIVGEISEVETFATGSGIREIARLRRIYGRGRWRKRKGIARVRLADGSLHGAEVHWYEAAGIGRKEYKIKHLL